MSQRRGMTLLSAELPRTIVRLCCSYLLLFVGLLFFSSICYSHLGYRLTPQVGHSVSEPGLHRPGKTRRSQTNKKPKRRRRASPNLVPVRGTSREHPQRNLQNVSPSFFSLLPSLPTLQAIRLTDDWTIAKCSQNASPPHPLTISLFPPLVSLCLEPAHMDWDQFRMKW